MDLCDDVGLHVEGDADSAVFNLALEVTLLGGAEIKKRLIIKNN